MSAPSDGARADARKARLAIADMVGIFAHLQPGAVSERVSGLADLIVADTDEPMWSAVVIAKHILASDWLAGVIANAKAEAWDEGFDAGERDVFRHRVIDDWSSECIRNPYSAVTS